MADANLLDLAKLNSGDRAVHFVDIVPDAAAEVLSLPVMFIDGTIFKTARRTELADASFRAANESQTGDRDEFEQILTECALISPADKCDKVIADGYAGGREAFWELKNRGIMRAAQITVGTGLWYGTGAAKDFVGLRSLFPKSNAQVIDAGGGTANTGSSVYGLKLGFDAVHLVICKNTPFKASRVIKQQFNAPAGGVYAGYGFGCSIWIGLAVENPKAVARICNLTAEPGKGLTDGLIAQMLAKCPNGFTPDALYMSRRSLMQLRQSRSATTNGPEEWSNGVRIIEANSITSTEAIE